METKQGRLCRRTQNEKKSEGCVSDFTWGEFWTPESGLMEWKGKMNQTEVHVQICPSVEKAKQYHTDEDPVVALIKITEGSIVR